MGRFCKCTFCCGTTMICFSLMLFAYGVWAAVSVGLEDNDKIRRAMCVCQGATKSLVLTTCEVPEGSKEYKLGKACNPHCKNNICTKIQQCVAHVSVTPNDTAEFEDKGGPFDRTLLLFHNRTLSYRPLTTSEMEKAHVAWENVLLPACTGCRDAKPFPCWYRDHKDDEAYLYEEDVKDNAVGTIVMIVLVWVLLLPVFGCTIWLVRQHAYREEAEEFALACTECCCEVDEERVGACGVNCRCLKFLSERKRMETTPDGFNDLISQVEQGMGRPVPEFANPLTETENIQPGSGGGPPRGIGPMQLGRPKASAGQTDLV